MTPTPNEMARSLPGSGWVTFAGVILITAGVIDIFNAIWAFRHDELPLAAWLFDGNLTAWGVIYLLLGIGLIVTGFYIFQRAEWATLVGIAVGVIGAVLHSFWIFTYPIASILLVTLNLLVVYGLTVYGGPADREAM